MKPLTYISNSYLRRVAVAVLVSSAGLVSAQTIRIDFGSSTTEPTLDIGWNNITETTPVDSPIALIDSSGATSGVSLTITQRFNGANANGSTSGTGIFVATSTRDSLFGNTAVFDGISAPNPTIEFSGLNIAATYDFELFASRMGVGDDRSATYTLTGSNTVSMDYNPSNNDTGTFNLNNLTPDASGVITLEMVASASNNNSFSFIYLGAVEITAIAVPEPGAFPVALGALALAALSFRRRRE